MARWNPKEFTQKLTSAVDSYDKQKAEELCDELISHLHSRVGDYPEDEAKQILASLRKKRYFGPILKVADAFIRSGLESPQIRRQYAQALLDEGDVSAGLAVLRPILQEEGVARRELAEVKGLIGRGYKQIYMDAGDSRPPMNRSALQQAITAYLEVYHSDRERFLWQGVNATSLITRAKRDGIDTKDFPKPEDIAAEIVKEVQERKRAGGATLWDLATAAEASIVLEDWENSALWLKEYVEHKEADAFELASTLRQFEEVIQLDREESNEEFLLDLLRSQLLRCQGGELHHSPAVIKELAPKLKEERTQLEKVLGVASYQPYRWLLTAFQRGQAVGRVWRGGTPKATGFLIPKASLLNPEWGDEQLFMTNSHVISKNPMDYRTLRPEQAEITFDALHGGGLDQPRYKVEWLWESSVNELDTTILKLDKRVEGEKRCPGITFLLELPEVDEKNRVYVIGHPHAGELSYSLQDNNLLGYNDTRIQYRSPTDPGSSGSPLFNGDWELIGIHHAGAPDMPSLDNPDETHPANEGIPLKAIIAAIQNA